MGGSNVGRNWFIHSLIEAAVLHFISVLQDPPVRLPLTRTQSNFFTEYCDFVVWNRNDIFVERILPDLEFWDDVIPKVECFFRKSILPEILGQQVTNLHV